MSMTKFARHQFLSGLSRSVCLVATGLILFAGIAQSAPLQAIPIQIVNTNAGRVMTAHADEYDGKVYIGGLVYRPPSPGIGPHVHVWGVDKNNHKVFFKTTSVSITGKPSFIRSEPYVVSVSPQVYNRAATIYVTFHSQSDAESQEN